MNVYYKAINTVVQSRKVRYWQWYGYLSQDYLGTSATLVRVSPKTRIGETRLIYILLGFNIFRLPRFWFSEGELVRSPAGSKMKGHVTIAKEASCNDGKDSLWLLATF